MSNKYAVRNLRLCTKDCLCLYVCPTGASDTENSIIDIDKCIGCGNCADACPSKAISMVVKDYPPQQVHQNNVIEALRALIQSKLKAMEVAKKFDGKIFRAIEESCLLMAEDLIRESGYMLAQSGNSKELLKQLLNDSRVNSNEVNELLNKIKFNEDKEKSKMKKWKCKVCGYIHQGDTPPEKCPICKQPSTAFELISDESATAQLTDFIQISDYLYTDGNFVDLTSNFEIGEEFEHDGTEYQGRFKEYKYVMHLNDLFSYTSVDVKPITEDAYRTLYTAFTENAKNKKNWHIRINFTARYIGDL